MRGEVCEGDVIPLDAANLRGLLRLLDDEQPVSQSLIDQIANMPDEQLQTLQSQMSNCTPGQRAAFEAALTRRGYTRHAAEWLAATARPRPALEHALIALGRAGGANEIDVSRRLDELAADVGSTLSGDRAFDNGMEALARVLTRAGLRGNQADYSNPGNSYLQSVLETGLGIPISLCCVAILVGQRLELPVCGIGAPGHFLGYYGDAELGLGSYFDPFSGFRRLSSAQVRSTLKPFTAVFHPSMLQPADERAILIRTLNNLQAAWQARGNLEHVRNLQAWQRVFEQAGPMRGAEGPV